MVAILRGRARAGADADGVVDLARLEHHRFVVTSGGGPGIMEAANRGASEAGGKTIGLNIRLPFEQGANPLHHRGPALRVPLLLHAQVLVCVPGQGARDLSGGFGTLDEMFEILTLMQTEKLAKQIQIILYGTEYWDPILNLEPMAEWGAIGPGDIDLIQPRRHAAGGVRRCCKAHLTEHHLMPPTAQEMKAPGIAKTRSRVRRRPATGLQSDKGPDPPAL